MSCFSLSFSRFINCISLSLSSLSLSLHLLDFICPISHYPFTRNEEIIRYFGNFEDYIHEESMWQISESIKPRGKKWLLSDSQDLHQHQSMDGWMNQRSNEPCVTDLIYLIDSIDGMNQRIKAKPFWIIMILSCLLLCHDEPCNDHLNSRHYPLMKIQILIQSRVME